MLPVPELLPKPSEPEKMGTLFAGVETGLIPAAPNSGFVKQHAQSKQEQDKARGAANKKLRVCSSDYTVPSVRAALSVMKNVCVPASCSHDISEAYIMSEHTSYDGRQAVVVAALLQKPSYTQALCRHAS